MGYVVNINSESAAAINLVNYLKTLDFVVIKKENKALDNLVDSEEKAAKKLKKILKRVDEARNGKIKTRSVEDFFNEL